MPVDRKAVESAVNSLRERGVKITNENVRETLGNVGSYSTISKLLREVLRDYPGDRPKTPTPQSIRDRGDAFVTEIWMLAEKIASESLRALTDEHERKLADVDSQNDELSAKVDELHEKLLQAEARLNEFHEKYNETKVRLANAEKENSDLSRGHLSQLVEIGETHAKLKAANDALERSQSDLLKSDARVERLLAILGKNESEGG